MTKKYRPFKPYRDFSFIKLSNDRYGGEKPFIIMDDPFTNLDDRRISGGRKFLKKAAESYQIIYLTCSEDRAKIL